VEAAADEVERLIGSTDVLTSPARS